MKKLAVITTVLSVILAITTIAFWGMYASLALQKKDTSLQLDETAEELALANDKIEKIEASLEASTQALSNLERSRKNPSVPDPNQGDALSEAKEQPHETNPASDETREQPGEANAASDETKEQLDQANSALNETREELDKANSALNETREELDKTNSALNETKGQLGEANSALEETKAQLDEANSALEETKAQLGEANSVLEETKARLNEANSALDAKEKQLSEANSALAALNNQLTETVSELQETKEQFEKARLSSDSIFDFVNPAGNGSSYPESIFDEGVLSSYRSKAQDQKASSASGDEEASGSEESEALLPADDTDSSAKVSSRMLLTEESVSLWEGFEDSRDFTDSSLWSGFSADSGDHAADSLWGSF